MKYFKGFALCLILSCGHPDEVPQKSDIRDTVVRNKVMRYTEDSTGSANHESAFEQNLAKLLGLQPVTEGSKELSLRVWLWDEEVKYVINLERINADYSCDLIGFNSRQTDSGEVIIIRHQVVNVEPPSGWTTVDTELKKLEKTLLTKPYKGRPGDLTHMSYVIFELSSNNSYSYAKYLEPSYHRFVEPDAFVVHNFLKTFNRELRLKAYLPAEKMYAVPGQ
ncbi:hypothetical protein [Flavitalea sp.]|nr:hypothetical protein [Flavitalea sp.]